MIKKNIVIVLMLLNPVLVLSAQNIISDNSFSLYSGDGKEFTEEKLFGKTTLFFYESRDTDTVNNLLKDVLAENDKKIKASNPNLALLAVANCRSAKWPFKGLWRDGLKKESISKGYTIYGDWDGKVCSRYNLQPGKANFLIINSDGDILYQNSGSISESEINKILKILI